MVDFNENVLHRRGDEGRDHIPAVPFWVAIIRAFQFLLTFLVMALSAFAASVFGAGYFAGYGMSFFIFAWTFAFLAYIFVTPLWFPQAYIVWAQLGLEIVTTIFWLSTFALLAEEAAAWDVFGDFGGLGIGAVYPKYNSAIAATKAAAGLGALVWLSFVVTLIVFGLNLHKWRVASGATGFGTGRAQVDAEKGNTVITTQPIELNHVPQQQEFAATTA